MPAKKKAKLRKVSIKLPFIESEWEADEQEERVLRDLVDQIRTRRAFELNRGMATEEPDHFLQSVLEARQAVRDLMKDLPTSAVESRLLLLEVQNRLADVLDSWQASVVRLVGRRAGFPDMPFPIRVDVMETAWPKVEKVRTALDKIAAEIEKMLDL